MNVSERPKVSIITCFLNVGDFLEEAVESILQQDYDHWELMLIDDGSTDKGTEIGKDYAKVYPGKIFFFEHEGHINKGLSASRNLGLRHCTGELIAFLDADDVWKPQLLSKLLAIMQQHPAAIVCEATEYWFSWSDPSKKDTVVTIGAEQDRLYYPPELMLTLYPLGKGAAPCVCGMLVKKEVLVRHGGFDEAFTGMYEDQVFLSKFYLEEPVYIASSCNNLYRQRQGSLVYQSHANGNYDKVRKRFLKWLEKYMHNKHMTYDQVRFYLKQALFPYNHPIAYTFIHKLPLKGKALLKKVLKMI
jgi:glycosyltransferase involved in cell wall biosynthesis